MSIKKKKFSFDILFFLFIIAIALGSYSSYSKYTSSISGSSSVNIAAWNVAVNTENITNNTTLQNNISFTPIQSQYVAQGKIAPSVGGYFDIIVNTINAEVASTYTINIDVTDLDVLNGLNVVGYKAYTVNETVPSVVSTIPSNLGNVTTTSKNSRTYETISGRVINLDSNGKGSIETVRVFLKWDDEGVNTNSTSIQIPINISVEQYFE